MRLSLVGADGQDGTVWGEQAAEIVIRIRVEVTQKPLTERVTRGLMGGMNTAVHETAQEAPEGLGPVAGRIEHQETDLSVAIASWLDDMRARRKKPRSIDAFREVMDRARRECGWSQCSDITFVGITTWLASKSWKGTTYNRNLSVFRSACAHMTRAKFLAEDPLAAAIRADDDGGEGARAATLEEARLMIHHAWIREQSGDRRVKGSPALWLACLFAAACRAGEPEQWKRRHLVLDAAVPHILWTREIQKNGRQMEVALCPELVTLLRRHLAAMDAEAAASGRTPTGEDLVFPMVPTKYTFVAIRNRAGIAASDRRGRSFSPHSARKFFATELTGRGVPEKMVDRLMRHSGRVEHRYYDPTLEEQAFAAAQLPTLWPVPVSESETAPDQSRRNVPKEKSSTSDLTRRGKSAEHEGVASASMKSVSDSTSDSGLCPAPPMRHTGSGPGPEPDVESTRAPGRGCTKRPRVGSPTHSGLEMPSSVPITGADPNDLADLLEALARVLRRRDADHGSAASHRPTHHAEHPDRASAG